MRDSRQSSHNSQSQAAWQPARYRCRRHKGDMRRERLSVPKSRRLPWRSVEASSVRARTNHLASGRQFRRRLQAPRTRAPQLLRRGLRAAHWCRAWWKVEVRSAEAGHAAGFLSRDGYRVVARRSSSNGVRAGSRRPPRCAPRAIGEACCPPADQSRLPCARLKRCVYKVPSHREIHRVVRAARLERSPAVCHFAVEPLRRVNHRMALSCG